MRNLALVDAANGFNNLSRKCMAWTARHTWHLGSRFAFNCYRHAAQLVVRIPGEPCIIILSEEGVTQGDPLAMILYGLTLIPMAATLRDEYPEVLQAWYADDLAMVGSDAAIARCLARLAILGPTRGYFPEPEKSILIVHPGPRAPSALDDLGMKIRDGHRYVGSFIGSDASRRKWLAPKIRDWSLGVTKLSKAARTFPQTAYAGLCRSFQQEWAYLQRVLPGLDDAFLPVEEAIRRDFLPALFQGTEDFDDTRRELLSLPVRYAGVGLPKPNTTNAANYEASVMLTAKLTDSLLARGKFSAILYTKAAAKLRRQLAGERDLDHATHLDEIQRREGQSPSAVRARERSTHTGAWLTAQPNEINGTDLGRDEFRDGLRLRYGLRPLNLPLICDGCKGRFSVNHAHDCKKNGLVTLQHNEVAQEFHHLCSEALTPSAVHDEPLIPSIHHGTEGEGAPIVEPELRGDVAVRGFWKRQRVAVFDVRITNTDNHSQQLRDVSAVLARHEATKKKKYGARCAAARMDFTPLIFSVDGMRGEECIAACKQLAVLLSKKWRQPYSKVCGFIRSRLSVAAVRSTSLCLRGCRDPTQRKSRPHMGDGAGLGLYR